MFIRKGVSHGQLLTSVKLNIILKIDACQGLFRFLEDNWQGEGSYRQTNSLKCTRLLASLFERKKNLREPTFDVFAIRSGKQVIHNMEFPNTSLVPERLALYCPAFNERQNSNYGLGCTITVHEHCYLRIHSKVIQTAPRVRKV